MTPIQPVGSLPYCVRGYLNLYKTAICPPTPQNPGWQHNWNGSSGVILFLQFLSETDEALRYTLTPLLQRLQEIPDRTVPAPSNSQQRWKPFQAELHALAPPETVLRALIEPRLEFFQGKLKQLNERRRAAQLQSYASDLNDPAMNGPFGPVVVGLHVDLEAYRLNAAFPNAFAAAPVAPSAPTQRAYYYNPNDPSAFVLATGRFS